jgi:hypothetical protein
MDIYVFSRTDERWFIALGNETPTKSLFVSRRGLTKYDCQVFVSLTRDRTFAPNSHENISFRLRRNLPNREIGK